MTDRRSTSGNNLAGDPNGSPRVFLEQPQVAVCLVSSRKPKREVKALWMFFIS
jgi:hypothetical protein